MMRRRPLRDPKQNRARKALKQALEGDMQTMIEEGLVECTIVNGEPAYRLTDAGSARLARMQSRAN